MSIALRLLSFQPLAYATWWCFLLQEGGGLFTRTGRLELDGLVAKNSSAGGADVPVTPLLGSSLAGSQIGALCNSSGQGGNVPSSVCSCARSIEYARVLAMGGASVRL